VCLNRQDDDDDDDSLSKRYKYLCDLWCESVILKNSNVLCLILFFEILTSFRKEMFDTIMILLILIMSSMCLMNFYIEIILKIFQRRATKNYKILSKLWNCLRDFQTTTAAKRLTDLFLFISISSLVCSVLFNKYTFSSH